MGIFGSLLALAFNAYHRETYPSAVFEIPRAVSLGESTCQRTLADKPPLLAEISMQLADVRKVAPIGPESACVAVSVCSPLEFKRRVDDGSVFEEVAMDSQTRMVRNLACSMLAMLAPQLRS